MIPARIHAARTSSLRTADNSDQEAILAFLRKNVGDCLYMYINVCAYGVDNPLMPVWVDRAEEAVHAVLTRYYNCLRLHCTESYSGLQDVARIVNETPHTLLFCSEQISARLQPLLSGRYAVVKSNVLEMPQRYRRFDFSKIERAEEKDLPEIVALLDSDPVYAGQCNPQELVEQMAHRMRCGAGASFIIRNESGEIVVSESIMAQTEELLIGSQLICRADVRKQFLSETMENYFMKLAVDTGRKLFGIIVDERRLRQWMACGAVLAGVGCKLIKITNVGEEN